jgi:hypothetical protein
VRNSNSAATKSAELNKAEVVLHLSSVFWTRLPFLSRRQCRTFNQPRLPSGAPCLPCSRPERPGKKKKITAHTELRDPTLPTSVGTHRANRPSYECLMNKGYPLPYLIGAYREKYTLINHSFIC